MSLKLAFDLKTNETIVCGGSRHTGDLPIKHFDEYVRALYFAEFKTLYFRFYNPMGEYYFIDDVDRKKSFRACEKALEAFVKDKLVPKNVRVLFWQTDNNINKTLIGY